MCYLSFSRSAATVRERDQRRQNETAVIIIAVSLITTASDRSRLLRMRYDCIATKLQRAPNRFTNIISYHCLIVIQIIKMSDLNRSSSENNICGLSNEVTPPNYVSQRIKRLREEDLPSEFNTFKDEMRELFTKFMNEQKSHLSDIVTELKEIQTTNSNIHCAINLLTSQNEESRKKIEGLELQVKKDREYIDILENRIEDLQRSNRKNCFEMKNVPRKIQESRSDLIGMVTCLAKNISLEMNPWDIKDIFRLQGRKNESQTQPIIVDLGSSILKNDLLSKVKNFNVKNKQKLQAKHLGHKTSEDQPVFISEQLTPKAARLFFLAREVFRTRKYKYCWTSFGRVYLRQDDNSRVVHVTSESQIHQLLQTA
jgi:hypothetical protein